ncbi:MULTISPECIES: hypothetical protein [Bradyrhizobium]|uniref:XRE family transcriptional regulator n=1 Tax=Bradyrhizobium ottawaense TaxID=931866 RepID=A0ABV4FUC3_9BRAD|nr:MULTISPECIES: hypothetical protein [Bradyrhizobium]MBR1292442.1 hypothetical protein [Bradyrhizobium ottawaense]WLB47604.1 hypothetical protein QIH93_06245 [Bradyrhizobium ottawaense]WLB65402.1 hypothetical protein QIH96_09560 [Bradyrhizobium japonicum]WQN84929.1 hypothetical protein U7859_11145 [Bradyrhizobium ottawaense]
MIHALRTQTMKRARAVLRRGKFDDQYTRYDSPWVVERPNSLGLRQQDLALVANVGVRFIANIESLRV